MVCLEQSNENLAFSRLSYNHHFKIMEVKGKNVHVRCKLTLLQIQKLEGKRQGKVDWWCVGKVPKMKTSHQYVTSEPTHHR